jgi:UDP-N-acetylmuramate--alanine ligase
VTNIDREHLDHYTDIEAIRVAFTEFVNKVPFYGAAILCLDSENVQSILPGVRRRTITYGRSAQADFQPIATECEAGGKEGGAFDTQFRLRSRAGDLGEFRLNIPGDHNVLNATAAIAAAVELGVPPEVIREGLKKFTGVGRRFEVRGEANGVTVVDDYGHHPTEIQATLAAAKSCCGKRVHVLFQPHRYTRTLHLMDDFARAFHAADRVVMLDIYAASEKPIEGVTAEGLVERMRQFGHRSVEYAGGSDAGMEAIVRGVEPGDMVVTLGAGSVSQLGDRILEKLRG